MSTISDSTEGFHAYVRSETIGPLAIGAALIALGIILAMHCLQVPCSISYATIEIGALAAIAGLIVFAITAYKARQKKANTPINTETNTVLNTTSSIVSPTESTISNTEAASSPLVIPAKNPLLSKLQIREPTIRFYGEKSRFILIWLRLELEYKELDKSIVDVIVQTVQLLNKELGGGCVYAFELIVNPTGQNQMQEGITAFDHLINVFDSCREIVEISGHFTNQMTPYFGVGDGPQPFLVDNLKQRLNYMGARYTNILKAVAPTFNLDTSLSKFAALHIAAAPSVSTTVKNSTVGDLQYQEMAYSPYRYLKDLKFEANENV